MTNNKEKSVESVVVSTNNESIKKSQKKKVSIGVLMSKVDYPLIIKYNGEEMRLSPRQKINNVNEYLLGELPKGVCFIKGK